MASIRRHPNASTRWQVRYRDPTGRQRTKSFAKKADADKFANLVEADKLRGDWSDPLLGRITFAEWCQRHQQGRLNIRKSTRVRDETLLRKMVLPHLGPMPLSNIQPATLRSWVAELDAAGYAPATIRKAYQLASAALEAAVEDGLIPKSPARGVGLPKAEHHEMRFLAGDEIAALADAIDPRYRALVLCAAYTGLRFGELAALRIDRVDFLRRSLRVEETLTEVSGHLSFGSPKTKASRRSVSLPAFLVDLLAAHIAEYGSDSGLIFTSPEGKPLRRTHFRRRVWKPAVAASVGEPCRVHDLRHSHAALLIAQGEHPKVIQSRLGHASITTSLNTYGHLFDGLDEAAADRLDDGFRAGDVDRMWTHGGHAIESPIHQVTESPASS